MSRDNFISDNLINIREQLRREQADKQSSAVAGSEHSSQASVEPEKAEQTALLRELPVTSPRSAVVSNPLESVKRELAGRIRQDYSQVAAELENLERKRTEALEFMEFLSKQKESVEAVDFGAEQSSRELDRLSYEYYQKSGRWKAFAGAVSAALPEQKAPEPVACGNRSLVISMIISALIVSATLLIVFL